MWSLDSSELLEKPENYPVLQHIYLSDFKVVDIVVSQIDLPVRVCEVYDDFH